VARSTESQIRYTQRQIKSDLALDRQRLQDYGASGPTNQCLGTQAQANGNIAAGADVTPSERRSAYMTVSREYSPNQRSASGDADIQTKPSYQTCVGIPSPVIGVENALHILSRTEDKPYPCARIACQRAGAERRLGIGSRRRQKGERTYADDCQDAAGIH
jgi:hypothetical protein